MPDFELTITICSWNTIEDTRACLASLERSREEGDFEVIVVDNASSDGSAQMVRDEFPWVRLLEPGENLGFTGGHNLALAQKRGRHSALLNSDTVVHPGAIATIIAFMREHPESGVVGPKLLNPDGSLQYSCRRFPNPVAAAFRNTWLGRLFPQNRAVTDYLMTDWDHASVRDVDWVSGAALFMREEVYSKIGGLDPHFFMYCEDVDICQRAWNAGWKVTYLPDAVITHAIGRSTDKVANKMIVRFHKSMFRYYAKHIAPKFFLTRYPALALAAGALALRGGLFLAQNARDALRRRFSR